MFALGMTVISLVVSYAQAQDANCNYVIYVSTGKTYTISSPNYSNNYTPGASCRWIGVCQDGYNCKVDCQLTLPESSSCSMDRLFISKTGDSQLSSANYYCGRGTVNAISSGTRISLALVTSKNGSGGRFRCDLSAQAASTPTCNCGYKKTNRIVGGEETRPNEYPMMAGIVYVGQNTIKCGGVIIDNSYVLTAAHCVANKTLDQIAVVVGEHDVTKSDSPNLQAFKVAAIKTHNQYNPDTLYNDIAIVRLNGMIVYSENVGPVCLPFKFTNNDFVGASVTILGWGTTTPGGPTSRVLRKANVDIISQSSCSRSVSPLTSRQMCTFTQGKDACQDDSGGPLLYQDSSNGRIYNVGVVSYGRFCASNYPGVNTRITAFLDWIVTNAPANYYVYFRGICNTVGIKLCSGPNPNCDYSISVTPGRSYPISSPNYPYSYYPGVSCRWIGVCPSGYKCRVDCGDIDLPKTTSCTMDRLLVSKSGDTQLTNAQYYCGRGTLTAVSEGTQISLGLVTSRNSPGGRFSCDMYAQVDNTPTCNCGYRKMNRIVGGEETRPNEYPMMAGIVYVGDNTIKCGAVIIDHSYVLTAAHCVANKTLNQIAVVVGEHDVTTGTDSPDLQAFKVARIISHQQYNPNTYDNDIAILQLRGSIVYSNNVGPVCLPFKFANNDFTGAAVTILGWGTTFPGGPDSKRLRKVNVNVISQSSCGRSVSTLTSRQMCTFTQGKDACQDDSGGPLLYPDPSNGRLYNVGVVSFGRFCASGSPGINTRITAFLNWIVTNAPANYCRI